MAKEKRSAADLDAELAALEAELAALEGKAKKGKRARAGPAPEPPRGPPPAPAEAAQPAPAATEKKGRFALPKLGKKEVSPAAAPAPAAAPSPAPPPPSAAPLSAPARAAPALPPPASAEYDLSLWRQDGDAWVRVVPDTPVASVRRVLDEEGNVVREEPVAAREIESTSAVKAERGLGRLLRRK